MNYDDAPEFERLRGHINDLESRIELLQISINELKQIADKQSISDEAIYSFIEDMKTVGRIGRLIRGIVGWLVFIGAGIALIWSNLSNSISFPKGH